MGTRAFIYARISEDREGAGLGVARQREDCQALAASLEAEVVEVFTDNDVSAYSGKPRKGYRAMLARLDEVDAILCWHTDRLHRNPSELEEYIALTESTGVATRTVKAGDLDLSTPHGRLVARQLGSLARYESEHKAERIARKMEELVVAGKWTGGTRPFGWDVVDRQLVLNDREATLVREAFDRVLSGESLASVVRWFDASGVTTTRGKQWGYAQLRQMLLRPRNAGLAERDGSVISRLEAAAIVSEDKFRAVERLLNDPGRRKSRTNRARFLLSGIAKCHCGEAVKKVVVSGRNGARHDTYRCPAKGPGHVGKRVQFVDSWVEDAALGLLASMELRSDAAPESSARREELEMKLRDIDRREDELARGAGTVDVSLLMKAGAALRKEREALRGMLADIALQEAHPAASFDHLTAEALASAEAKWAAWSLDAKRDFVRHNLTVRLLPQPPAERRRFVPETVEVRTWDGALPIAASDWRRSDEEWESA
jgi:DNA invertase Pin-like site-specific DNA recombinase